MQSLISYLSQCAQAHFKSLRGLAKIFHTATETFFRGIFRSCGAGIFSVLYWTREVTYFYRHIAFFHGILYVCQYKTQFARCNMVMPCVMPKKYMNMPVSNVQGIFEGHEFCVSWCLSATFRQAPRRLFVHENNVFGKNKMYLLTIRSLPPSTKTVVLRMAHQDMH